MYLSRKRHEKRKGKKRQAGRPTTHLRSFVGVPAVEVKVETRVFTEVVCEVKPHEVETTVLKVHNLDAVGVLQLQDIPAAKVQSSQSRG